MTRLSRRNVVLAIAALIVLAAGVTVLVVSRADKPIPSVTLRSGEVGVRVQATRWCPEGGICKTHRRDVPVLRVRSNSDVVIEVGPAVVSRPWLVLVDGSQAGPLQRRSKSYKLTGVTGPLLVEVVTVDSDGKVVLQRDRWVFRIENR
ncbi:MAG: hypothetical protein WCB04_05475 [Mycobacteriales bacterium]